MATTRKTLAHKYAVVLIRVDGSYTWSGTQDRGDGVMAPAGDNAPAKTYASADQARAALNEALGLKPEQCEAVEAPIASLRSWLGVRDVETVAAVSMSDAGRAKTRRQYLDGTVAAVVRFDERGLPVDADGAYAE